MRRNQERAAGFSPRGRPITKCAPTAFHSLIPPSVEAVFESPGVANARASSGEGVDALPIQPAAMIQPIGSGHGK